MRNHPPLVSRQTARAELITWLGLLAVAWPTTTPALAQDHIVVDVVLCASHCERVVLRVWDGDTFRIGFGHDSERVRLEHIDAPEIEGRCPFEIELAQRSKLRLAELLRDRDVSITRNGQDVHGGTLATLSVAGVDVGDILVSEGLARIWNGRRASCCPGRRSST
jgi:endonuclease YncB( thermonuclease family)